MEQRTQELRLSESQLRHILDHAPVAMTVALGQAMGDEAICEVVRARSQLVRKQDLVGRLGGEEFALLPRTELESARSMVERLREKIAAIALHKAGKRVPGLTASFGLTALRPDTLVEDDLLARADEGL